MTRLLMVLTLAAGLLVFTSPASSSASTTATLESCGAQLVTSDVGLAELLICGECCPTYDPKYDCWAEGHWHYNHCNEGMECGVET